MYYSESKSKKQKKRKEHNTIGKSGDRLTLSATGDKIARKYLDDTDTLLPEKFRYKQTEGSRKMRTVKPSYFSEKSSGERSGEFSFDTGWMEMGYDKEKKETIISVQKNYKNERARSVSENSSRKVEAEYGKRAMSNDPEFKEGAIALRCDKSRDYKQIRKQIARVSKDRNNETTYDEVLPFHQTEQQKQKLKQLRELQKNTYTDRTGIGKAITGVQTYLNNKQRKNLEFNQKFERAVNENRNRFRSATGDDFLLFVKKQLAEEKVLDTPQDDKDNNENNEDKQELQNDGEILEQK